MGMPGETAPETELPEDEVEVFINDGEGNNEIRGPEKKEKPVKQVQDETAKNPTVRECCDNQE